MGAGTLTETEAYRPVFSWPRFAEFSVRALNTLGYTERFTIGLVLTLWALILGIAVFMWRFPGRSPRHRDPRWMFWWVWVIVTPLPIAFLPRRGGAMLYIPAAGWSMLSAMGVRVLARRAARYRIFGLPTRVAMAILLVAAASLYSYETRLLEKDQVVATLASGTPLKRFISDLNGLGFRPPGRGLDRILE